MKKTTYPIFSFGATSRPLSLTLAQDEWYFGLRFCDCTGLSIVPHDYDPHGGINLRTHQEVRRCAEWIETLYQQSVTAETTVWVKPEILVIAGFSPEFEDESCQWGNGPDEFYDATALCLHGVWRSSPEDGTAFHLAAEATPNPEDVDGFGLDAPGIPHHLMPVFAEALLKISRAMETDSLDLSLEEPMN